MLNTWYGITSPIGKWENASVEEKINNMKGQCLSVASIILIIFYILLGIIEKEILSGVALSVLTFFMLFFLNRKGYVRASCFLSILAIEASAIFLLLYRGETTGISILMLTFVVSALCLSPYINIVLIILNTAILTVFMIGTKQLFTNIMWTRFLIQFVLAFSAYLSSFLIKNILAQASSLQTIVNNQKVIEIKNKILEDERSDLNLSLMMIRSAVTNFENKNRGARVNIFNKKNTLKDISAVINTLLSKQEKLQMSELEFKRLEMAISTLSNAIIEAKMKNTDISCGLTKTPVDSIIIEISGKRITE